jgi:hypothetical protein
MEEIRQRGKKVKYLAEKRRWTASAVVSYKQCWESISGRIGIIYRIRTRIMEFNLFYMKL